MKKIIKYLPAAVSAAAVGWCAALCVSAQSDEVIPETTETTAAVTEDISSGWEYSDDGKVYYYDTGGSKLPVFRKSTEKSITLPRTVQEKTAGLILTAQECSLTWTQAKISPAG